MSYFQHFGSLDLFLVNFGSMFRINEKRPKQRYFYFLSFSFLLKLGRFLLGVSATECSK